VVDEPLTATGCSASELEWKATIPAGLGITLSAGGNLSGVLKKTGSFTIEVNVRNRVTNSAYATKNLSLTVNGKSSTACPTIRVKGQPSAALAPSACEAWDYSAEFEVTGGSPLYAWSAINPPAGLTFDALSYVLSGHPTAGGTTTLRVTDGTGRIIQRDFEIPLRKKCWFGYVSDETGANRMHLFDPLLKTRLDRPTSNDASLSVADFKFSPDGKFVAYRVKGEDGNYKLALWQAPKWDRDYAFSFGNSVTHYEWSKDSGVLAVAYTTDDDTLLGGVKVTDVPDESPAGLIQGHSLLAPVSAPLDSEITWYGDETEKYVAFHSLENPGYPQRVIYYAQYLVSGFSDWDYADMSAYSEPLFIYPGLSTGLYVTQGVGTVLKYFPNDMSDTVLHGSDAVSPSGAYTASAKDGRLQLFHAYDTSFGTNVSPWKTGEGCGQILGWATTKERIACLDPGDPNNPNDSTVRIFTLGVGGISLGSEAVTNSQPYVSDSWSTSRRLFSPSGDWLALTTRARLYLGYFGSGVSSVVWTNELPETASAMEMAFSPDEDLLGLQSGQDLYLFEPQELGNVKVPIGQLSGTASACQEERLATPTWCGSDRANRQFVWSPRSDSIAFVNSSGALRIEDLRIRPIVPVVGGVDATLHCVDTCVGGFRFQP
jgi:hypothetical protein